MFLHVHCPDRTASRIGAEQTGQILHPPALALLPVSIPPPRSCKRHPESTPYQPITYLLTKGYTPRVPDRKHPREHRPKDLKKVG